jgi:hypothetical protein
MRIIALLVIVAGCRQASPAPGDERQRAAMRIVVNAQQSEARVMRAKLEATKNRVELFAAVAVYLDAMTALDLSSCPADFVESFRAYLASWRTFTEVLADPNADTKPEAAEIDRRWDAVLELARSHRAVK